MQRTTEQPSLADALVERRRRPRYQRLRRIDEAIDWAPFERILAVVHNSPVGRPAFPALPLFKALLLKEWHSLSDEQLEEELLDRASYREFCGFRVADKIPDHSTICRYRNGLAELGLGAALFAELRRQLTARGLLLEQGRAALASTAIEALDATVVEAQASRKRVDSPKGPTDPDAAFTRLNGEVRYGYKAHCNVDLETMLVAEVRLTPANVNETVVADQLLTGQERSVHADRAYDARARERRYAERDIDYNVMRRGNKHHPLPAREVERNRRLSRERMPMEGVFGVLKRAYHYTRTRYFSLRRNLLELQLKVFAYDLRRLARLTAAA